MTLPFLYTKQLNTLVRDGKLDSEMLTVLASMPERLQVAFIDALWSNKPEVRAPQIKHTPHGVIEGIEELKDYRARTIRSILSLQRDLGYDGRQRRANGTGSIFFRQDKDRPTPYWVGFVDIGTGEKRKRKKLRGKTKVEVERKMQPYMTGDAVDSEAEWLRKLGARSITQLEALERNLQELWKMKQREQKTPRFGGVTTKAEKNEG